ncbi:lytic transglycosylase domain-containing protein [Agromyces atrinae]|uniref:lytic transglycosylase domain-containing protein n=1 Tax=Agromyces atrinae TaxID=592376 RepID=UPI0024133545|nr:lytic murein transglycosylase [Agromyces atrinae]
MGSHAAAPRRRRTAVLLATVGFGALGAVAVAGSLAFAAIGAGDDARGQASPTAQATAAPQPSTADDGIDVAPESTATPISALADAAWVSRVASAAGIPERALAAYAGATLRATSERPACGLSWNTLAGIGSVESEHGTIDGSALDAAGVAVPPIVGIALDGGGVDAIGDTDGGALDGDATWDRAVGPMQFIPSTWSTHGVDGDGDGRADPQNIDDAVLSAAYYLCDTGVDLATPAGWIAAVSAYNSSIEYNNRVAAVADVYATVG